VGLYCFNDREREWHAPGGTPRHLDLLLHRLENTEAAGETLLPEALRRADALVRRRCTLAVVSDFYCDPAACFEALNPFVHRGCDLHLLHLQDPVERDLPDAAFLNFQDLENGQRLRADPKSLRENYRKALEAHHGAFRALAMRRGIQYRVVGTDEPVVSSLAGLVG